MPRISVNLSDEVVTMLKAIAKPLRGRFVEFALKNFINSPDGEKLLNFLKSSDTTAVNNELIGNRTDLDGILSEFTEQ